MFSFKSSLLPTMVVYPVATGYTITPVKSVDGLKIVIVLDESGSMHLIRNDIIGSINAFIEGQRGVKTDVDGIEPHFTLVKFNSNVNCVCENTLLSEVREFSQSDYTPAGSTALYDAVGDTIEWFNYETNVLMVIITDGEENASTKFTHSKITQMINEKKEFRGWSYVYLANDLSVARQGTSLGLGDSKFSSNVTRSSKMYGKFISDELNVALQNQRLNGVTVQSQLNTTN